MNTNTGDTEVTWDGGAGHQPYGNRDPVRQVPASDLPETDEPAADHTSPGNQFADGDRHERSGNNQKQLEEVKGVP